MALPIGNKIPEEPGTVQNGQVPAAHCAPEHDREGRTYL